MQSCGRVCVCHVIIDMDGVQLQVLSLCRDSRLCRTILFRLPSTIPVDVGSILCRVQVCVTWPSESRGSELFKMWSGSFKRPSPSRTSVPLSESNRKSISFSWSTRSYCIMLSDKNQIDSVCVMCILSNYLLSSRS